MQLNQMKIGARVSMGYGVLLLLLLGVLGLTYVRLESLQADNTRLLELQRRAAVAEDWRSQVYLNASRALGIAKSGGHKALDDYYGPLVTATSERISVLQKTLGEQVDSEKGKALIASIAVERQAYLDARKVVFDKLHAGDVPAAQELLASRMNPAADKYVGAIDTLTRFQESRVAEGHAQVALSVRNTEMLALSVGLVAILVSLLLGWRITRSVVEPIKTSMAVTERVAAGDLTQTIEATGRDEMSEMLRSLGRMQQALLVLVSGVRSSSDSIGTASAQIAGGNQDLSARTEQTASNLQQAASSLEQLTGTVSQTADSARTANQLAASASQAAQRGGVVVAEVVSTMDEINGRSKKIADIISTIDGIAFQTNILALNAAVEAARAGEQGRGFAVVAGEVRSLAQRSAEAAKEIKGLIQASVEKVEAGSRLVADAGSTMTEIVGSVRRVTDVIGEISAATAEQTTGLRQVNEAVAQLDQMTQQNAALVEESAAAAESLREQSRQLSSVVAGFKVDAGGPAAGARPSMPSPAVTHRAMPSTAAAAASAAIAQVRQKAAAPARPAAPAVAKAPPVTAPKAGPAPAPSSPSAAGEGDWESF